jgi:hypothetical protein
MTITSNILRRTVLGVPLVTIVVAWALPLPSCSSESKQPDCVPADGAQTKKGATYEMTPLVIGNADKKNNDWCRACVMGPNRFASCQRVYGDTPTEPRDAIRERARIKACVDSGFKADACPTGATIGIACKGDPPPPNAGNPAKILQDMYKQMNPPPVGTGSTGTAPPKDDPSKTVLE